LQNLRAEYRRESLDESQVVADPVEQFRRWFNQAVDAQLPEPNAMALATADGSGAPACRMVLLKDFSDRGFVFCTDYRSRKGGELEDNARAALCFWWGPLERQVRITGRVTRTDTTESEAHFNARPRGSQLGAWASAQSSVIADRAALEASHAEVDRKYSGGAVPLPPHWGGFRVIPDSFEFWQGRESRLHDRLRYRPEGKVWIVERLSP
jgi:pyridoxamine 5'-phosphate oxidase